MKPTYPDASVDGGAGKDRLFRNSDELGDAALSEKATATLICSRRTTATLRTMVKALCDTFLRGPLRTGPKWE